VSSPSSTSNAAGSASTSVTVGPLDEGETASVTACESQSSVCAGFSVYASHAEQAGLLPVSGVNQSLAASSTPLPVTLLVIDGGGHPLAGATVDVYQQMDAWEPPCPDTGRCPAAPELGSASVTLTSDANGLVTFSPMNGGGEPVVVRLQATTGDQGLLNFTVVQTP
jgi:protocatechuate 3,4-dioxygenase beta subunit